MSITNITSLMYAEVHNFIDLIEEAVVIRSRASIQEYQDELRLSCFVFCKAQSKGKYAWVFHEIYEIMQKGTFKEDDYSQMVNEIVVNLIDMFDLDEDDGIMFDKTYGIVKDWTGVLGNYGQQHPFFAYLRENFQHKTTFETIYSYAIAFINQLECMFQSHNRGNQRKKIFHNLYSQLKILHSHHRNQAKQFFGFICIQLWRFTEKNSKLYKDLFQIFLRLYQSFESKSLSQRFYHQFFDFMLEQVLTKNSFDPYQTFQAFFLMNNHLRRQTLAQIRNDDSNDEETKHNYKLIKTQTLHTCQILLMMHKQIEKVKQETKDAYEKMHQMSQQLKALNREIRE